MTSNVVARRYAKALFNFAKKAGKEELGRCSTELGILAKAVASSPALEDVFRNPSFLIEEKRSVLVKLMEQTSISASVRNFCNILLDKGRLPYLKDICSFYNIILDVERGVIRGELITAVELKDQKRNKVQGQLAKQTSYKLELAYSVSPSILGGVVLKVGDQVMDASIKAQLSMLKDNIKRGE